jgi:hypothetical protein
MDLALDGFRRSEFALDELLGEDPYRRRGEWTSARCAKYGSM